MSKDECGTCMERKAPYPKNLKESSSSSSSIWSFWKSGSKSGSGSSSKGDCGPSENKAMTQAKEEAARKLAQAKEDACKSLEKAKEDAARKLAQAEEEAMKALKAKEEECKAETWGTGKDGKFRCKPFPASEVPVLCMPAWFKCPPTITVPPFQAPKGVEIKPISEGGRNSKCEGGKCGKCGHDRPPSGPPKVSGNCPMVRNKPCGGVAAQASAAKEGLLKRITSFFSFGKDKK